MVHKISPVSSRCSHFRSFPSFLFDRRHTFLGRHFSSILFLHSSFYFCNRCTSAGWISSVSSLEIVKQLKHLTTCMSNLHFPHFRTNNILDLFPFFSRSIPTFSMPIPNLFQTYSWLFQPFFQSFADLFQPFPCYSQYFPDLFLAFSRTIC